MEAQSLDEIINQCIDRMLRGEPLERVLASHADRAAELRPALAPAAALLGAPAPVASPAPRARAMQTMLEEVNKPQVAVGMRGVKAMFGSFGKYPLALRGAALVAAMALVGAAGLGGAAAMGGGPEPVREFFGFSRSTIEVEFEGVIVSVEGDTLVIAIGAGERSVTVAADAEISRGGHALTLADLAAGDFVEVEGVLQSDNSILATRVHVEDDDDDDGGAATPGPTLGLPVIAPADDHGDDDDDGIDDHGDDADDDIDDSHDRDCDATPAPGDHSDSGAGSCDDDDDIDGHDDAGDDIDGHDDGTETPEVDDDGDDHDDDAFEDSQHTPDVDDDDGDDDHEETRTPEPDDADEDEEDSSGSGH